MAAGAAPWLQSCWEGKGMQAEMMIAAAQAVPGGLAGPLTHHQTWG